MLDHEQLEHDSIVMENLSLTFFVYGHVYGRQIWGQGLGLRFESGVAAEVS
jgi:hypothetical protein